ncbi:neuromedin-B isoform 2-T2 [Molossus nigricans]
MRVCMGALTETRRGRRACGRGRRQGRAPQTGPAPRGSGFKSREGGCWRLEQMLAAPATLPAPARGLGAAMALRAGGSWWFGGVLLFALLAAGTASLSWDLPEPRSRASKIRVHSRGNLWATGHFMGKKSLEAPSPSLLGTAPDVSLKDQRLQLSHELFRILLLKKALGTSPGSPAPHTQYRRLLVQMLQK